jgi:hypothetical protein
MLGELSRLGDNSTDGHNKASLSVMANHRIGVNVESGEICALLTFTMRVTGLRRTLWHPFCSW